MHLTSNGSPVPYNHPPPSADSQAGMPMIMSSRAAHSQPSQGDLDLLALLTSDSSSMGPLSTGPGEHRPKKLLPRRENPVDALLISAVLAGSGPVTRHHLGHGVARPHAYASCDESRPSTPSRDPIPSKVVMRSLQAPRSERLRAEKQEEKLGQSSSPPADHEPVKSARSMSSSFGSKDRPRRRMSIDPAPVSQILQAASPSANFFTSYPQPAAVPRRLSTTRPLVRCMARTRIPTPHGELFLHLYHNSADNKEHLAIVIDPIQLSPDERAAAPRGRREIRSRSLNEKWREGETDMERVVRGAYVGRLGPGGEDQASSPSQPGRIEEESEVEDILPLVRIHSECFTGETIGSMRCDCGEQLDEALRLIARPQLVSSAGLAAQVPPTPADSRSPSPSSGSSRSAVPGRGVVIYMRQEGRGIGLLEKIRAYNLQDLGHDTVTANLMLGHGADERKYDVAAEILRDLGLAGEGGEAIRLLTNNPDKVGGLSKEGVRVRERVGMVPRDWKCRDRSHGKGYSEGRGDGDVMLQEKDYAEWRERRAGVGLIGAGKASGVELEKYLRTKVERMGHIIDIPEEQA